MTYPMKITWKSNSEYLINVYSIWLTWSFLEGKRSFHFLIRSRALFSYMNNNINYELLLISSQLQNPFKRSEYKRLNIQNIKMGCFSHHLMIQAMHLGIDYQIPNFTTVTSHVLYLGKCLNLSQPQFPYLWNGNMRISIEERDTVLRLLIMVSGLQ